MASGFMTGECFRLPRVPQRPRVVKVEKRGSGLYAASMAEDLLQQLGAAGRGVGADGRLFLGDVVEEPVERFPDRVVGEIEIARRARMAAERTAETAGRRRGRNTVHRVLVSLGGTGIGEA